MCNSPGPNRQISRQNNRHSPPLQPASAGIHGPGALSVRPEREAPPPSGAPLRHCAVTPPPAAPRAVAHVCCVPAPIWRGWGRVRALSSVALDLAPPPLAVPHRCRAYALACATLIHALRPLFAPVSRLIAPVLCFQRAVDLRPAPSTLRARSPGQGPSLPTLISRGPPKIHSTSRPPSHLRFLPKSVPGFVYLFSPSRCVCSHPRPPRDTHARETLPGGGPRPYLPLPPPPFAPCFLTCALCATAFWLIWLLCFLANQTPSRLVHVILAMTAFVCCRTVGSD